MNSFERQQAVTNGGGNYSATSVVFPKDEDILTRHCCGGSGEFPYTWAGLKDYIEAVVMPFMKPSPERCKIIFDLYRQGIKTGFMPCGECQ